LARVTDGAVIASRAAAIDVAFVLILDAVVAGTDRRARHRAAVAVHRDAIAVLRTRIAKPAWIARGSTAIDIGFVLIFDAVAARRRRNALGGIGITRVARAIGILQAAFADVTRAARAAAAIHVRLRAVLLAVVAGRSGLTHLAHRIARIARAIGIFAASFANVALVACCAAAIGVRFVLIFDAIAARGRTRVHARGRRYAIIADFTGRRAIEQRDPLPAIVRIWRTALDGFATALRRADGWTAVIAATTTTTAAVTTRAAITCGTTIASLIGRRVSIVTAANDRRSSKDQHEKRSDPVPTHLSTLPRKTGVSCVQDMGTLVDLQAPLGRNMRFLFALVCSTNAASTAQLGRRLSLELRSRPWKARQTTCR